MQLHYSLLVSEPKPLEPSPIPPVENQEISTVVIQGPNTFKIGDSINLRCKVTMNQGITPSDGITYK